MKKLLCVLLITVLSVCLFSGCVAKLTDEEALAQGKTLFETAEKLCDWNLYVFEKYEESELTVSYKLNDEYYFKIANKDDFDYSLISGEAFLKLKQSAGFALTESGDMYVKIWDAPSLYHHSELQVTEITAEHITYTVTSYYYAGWATEPQEGETSTLIDGSPDTSLWTFEGEPTVTKTYSFAIGRAYNEVENEKGKTIKEYFWYIQDFTNPF